MTPARPFSLNPTVCFLKHCASLFSLLSFFKEHNPIQYNTIGYRGLNTYKTIIVLYWVVLFEKKLKRENKEAQCFRKQTVGSSEKDQ